MDNFDQYFDPMFGDCNTLFVVALNKVSDLLSSPNHLILLRHRPNLKHKNLKVLHVFAQTDQAQSFLVGFKGH